MPSGSNPPNLPSTDQVNFGDIFIDFPPASTLPTGDPGIGGKGGPVPDSYGWLAWLDKLWGGFGQGTAGSPQTQQENANAGAVIMGKNGEGLPGANQVLNAPDKAAQAVAQASSQALNGLASALQGIGLDFHSSLQGLQEGLPIFGVFAMLFVVFLVGLGMFLFEGERSVVREVIPSGSLLAGKKS